MDGTVSPTRIALETRQTYGQVLRDILTGKLEGFQDERGRWYVRSSSAEIYIKSNGLSSSKNKATR